MEQSKAIPKVYFTDFRTPAYGDSIPVKFQKLLRAAGIDKLDMDGKFVAIKTHFGELGNISFLRPNYARTVVDIVRGLGGIPFLTDCNTMYPGSRKNGIEHLYCAWQNGFTPLTVNAPIIIADGLRGTDEVVWPVRNGVYCKEAYIGRAIADADVFISLSHFKGHEMTGFGGALKNIGMGCGSRAGKKNMHTAGKPEIDADLCRGCKRCAKECANSGLVFDADTKKMTVDYDHCVGCGRCLGACNFDALQFAQDNAVDVLGCSIAEYSQAVLDQKPSFHISIVCDISPNCDCHSENDAPILPNIGMFASFDALALDQACADACNAAEPLPNTQLTDHMHALDFVDKHDHFDNCGLESSWKPCLEHAEKIGLGSRKYELVTM